MGYEGNAFKKLFGHEKCIKALLNDILVSKCYLASMSKPWGTVLQRTVPSHFAILLSVHKKQYSCYLSDVFIFHVKTAR